MKDNRKLKNYLVSPKSQFRLILLVSLISGLTYLLIIGLVLNWLLAKIAVEAEAFSLQPVFEQKLFALIHQSIFPICFAGVLLIFLLGVITVAITHRFYGPMIPIKRFTNEIKNGNYAARVSIRDNDELHDIVRDLNEMAIELERRHAK